ncbi:hypothetical protein B0I27_101179 [Arcticibacter pallidicorallinus]|uniref:Uncharacterized protein n=1 Tax=Arcticibacter pallidicorallinus TaxID=1259464 RepID=A0A2T0UB90_9SPHI|nr:hypothetical protein B0I27_101179 [Arcticibacter pallidicorallinus]
MLRYKSLNFIKVNLFLADLNEQQFGDGTKGGH